MSGEEEAKKTQNLGLSDTQRRARARIGFFALSLIDLSLGTALSLQDLCPADKTTYNISQSCSVVPLYTRRAKSGVKMCHLILVEIRPVANLQEISFVE